ncbi:hypothetical protein D3C87_2021930 [compost metagenome]
MHHDVFGFACLNHALNTGQQAVNQLLLGFRHLAIALNKTGFGAEHHFDFTQTVRFERRAGRH